ncbi:MAG: phosphatase PAP2 family protein, partial [Pseudomonadota bacterium]
LSPSIARFTHELLDLALGVASHVVLSVKHILACPRPDAFSPQIQPVIPTPGHSALPSGHATEAFTAAVVLASVMNHDSDLTKMLMRQAARIAVNRTVAGVHYPVDSIAGAMLGLNLGQMIVALAGQEHSIQPATFQIDEAIQRNATAIVNDDGTQTAETHISFNPASYDVVDGANVPPDEKFNPLKQNKAVEGAVQLADKALTDLETSDSLAWLWTRARAEVG